MGINSFLVVQPNTYYFCCNCAYGQHSFFQDFVLHRRTRPADKGVRWSCRFGARAFDLLHLLIVNSDRGGRQG